MAPSAVSWILGLSDCFVQVLAFAGPVRMRHDRGTVVEAHARARNAGLMPACSNFGSDCRLWSCLRTLRMPTRWIFATQTSSRSSWNIWKTEVSSVACHLLCFETTRILRSSGFKMRVMASWQKGLRAAPTLMHCAQMLAGSRLLAWTDGLTPGLLGQKSGIVELLFS